MTFIYMSYPYSIILTIRYIFVSVLAHIYIYIFFPFFSFLFFGWLCWLCHQYVMRQWCSQKLIPFLFGLCSFAAILSSQWTQSRKRAKLIVHTEPDSGLQPRFTDEAYREWFLFLRFFWVWALWLRVHSRYFYLLFFLVAGFGGRGLFPRPEIQEERMFKRTGFIGPFGLLR